MNIHSNVMRVMLGLLLGSTFILLFKGISRKFYEPSTYLPIPQDGVNVSTSVENNSSTRSIIQQLPQLNEQITSIDQISFLYTTMSHPSIPPLPGKEKEGIETGSAKIITDEPMNLTSELPIILIWTAEGWATKRIDFSQQVKSCPVQCMYTTDRRFESTANATVFHLRDIGWPKDMPKVRHPWQRYVAWQHEAAGWYYGLPVCQAPHIFNWSMTYRMDSDVPAPYGVTIGPNVAYQDIELEKSSNRKEQLFNRTELVAWASSMCASRSGRLDYVKELRQYIKIDVYGNKKCLVDSLECPKSNNPACLEMMSKKYLFYLAFENSICDGYITEKLWEKMEVFMVPVVLRKKDYEGIVPPYSIIAADDFPGPQELAAYLTYLSTNLTAYMEYFQWRVAGYKTCTTMLYTYHQFGYPTMQLKNCGSTTLGFCRLCEMLHGKKPQKSYATFAEWFMPEPTCIKGYSRTISGTSRKRPRNRFV